MSERSYRLAMITGRRPLTCATVLPMVLLSGCGSKLAEVRGSVSIDGRTVTGGQGVRGTVLFSPREEGHPTGSGVLNRSGEYSVYVGANEGLPPGPYAIAVTVTKIVPPATPGGTPSGRLITPQKYADPRHSGLEVEVAPGNNTFDFALQSDHPTNELP